MIYRWWRFYKQLVWNITSIPTNTAVICTELTLTTEITIISLKKTSREAVTSNTSWHQARIIASMKRSLSRNSKTSITLLTCVEFSEDKTNLYNYTFFTSRLSWSQVKINTIFSYKKPFTQMQQVVYPHLSQKSVQTHAHKHHWRRSPSKNSQLHAGKARLSFIFAISQISFQKQIDDLVFTLLQIKYFIAPDKYVINKCLKNAFKLKMYRSQ